VKFADCTVETAEMAPETVSTEALSRLRDLRNVQNSHKTPSTHTIWHMQRFISHNARQTRSANKQKSKNREKQPSQRKTSKQPARPLCRSKTTHAQVSGPCQTRQTRSPHIIETLENILFHTKHLKRSLETCKILTNTVSHCEAHCA